MAKAYKLLTITEQFNSKACLWMCK